MSMHPMHQPSPDRPFKPPVQYFGIHMVIHSIHSTLLISPSYPQPVHIFVFT